MKQLNLDASETLKPLFKILYKMFKSMFGRPDRQRSIELSGLFNRFFWGFLLYLDLTGTIRHS